MPEAAVDLAALADLAEELAQQAGTLVREGRRQGVHDVDTKTSATDMVTEFDTASEALIVAGLLAARPHDAVIGEEGASRPGTSGVEWLVDPIDGTTNFLYGLPGYAVSIAARNATGPLVGVVYVPVAGETFRAVRGGGATLDGRAIRCSAKADLPTALVATGFNYDPAERVRQGAVIARLLGRVRDIRRFGAAAVDLCHVACGRVDAYYERGLSDWDLAAGQLIATEAGAVVGDFTGGPARPGEVMAANPVLYTAMADLLDDAGAVIRPPAS